MQTKEWLDQILSAAAGAAIYLAIYIWWATKKNR